MMSKSNINVVMSKKRRPGRPKGSKGKEKSAYLKDDSDGERKKDKKLVFLSKSVLQKIRERPMVTGTQIANEILEMYKHFYEVSDYLKNNISSWLQVGQQVDFKNVQRRVYDALNVLSAIGIIRKDK